MPTAPETQVSPAQPLPAGARPRAVVILAAGQGTRMRSARPKVLHEVGGRAMLGWSIDLARAIGAGRIVVVCAPDAAAVHGSVRTELGEEAIVIQAQALGTAHAVGAASEALSGFDGDVVVLFADTPLIRPQTITALLDMPADGIRVLGFEPAEPGAYGRLVTGADGAPLSIVEALDATPEQRAIRQCNSGVLAGAADVLMPLVAQVGNANAKGEYYLPDVVAMATRAGRRNAMLVVEATEVAGVNSKAELAAAEGVFQARARRAALEAGVLLMAPDTVHFSHDTALAADVTVEPNVVFAPGVRVEAGARIRAFSHLEGASVGAGCEVGPFARLRPGTRLASGVKVGNFVELKNARIAAGAKVNHLSYVGDAVVGERANLGAGTITCNYDGFGKFETVIGAGAFIGSNTCLVAPVRVGENAYTATGTVVTHDVEPDALAVGRARQVVKPGWAARFRLTRGGAGAGEGRSEPA
jgi:bifunctional UDP-N-acetylglucosamine pyrophosphorylase/glucosamine-1-phosphate N-acetyltransferase